MAKIAVPRVAEILADRRARIDGDLAAAQKARDEAEAAGAAYEKSFADARNRAQTIANETRDKFAAEADKPVNRSRLSSTTSCLRPKRRSRPQRPAMTNVRGISVDAARRSSSG